MKGIKPNNELDFFPPSHCINDGANSMKFEPPDDNSAMKSPSMKSPPKVTLLMLRVTCLRHDWFCQLCMDFKRRSHLYIKT